MTETKESAAKKISKLENQILDELQKCIIELEKQNNNLTKALAKIATLSGYSNHLREFGIEKWVPGKKDMGKRYAG